MHLRPAAAVPVLFLVVALAAWPARPGSVSTQSSLPAQAVPRSANPSPSADEFVGPFPSWTNVRTQHGATGDGAADDTSALQAALDRLGGNDGSPVVFIPAGTYRITKSLSLNYGLGVAVIGEDPERTRILWDGPDEGTMMVARGMAYSRINRLTFDGRGKAAVAVEQTWNNKNGNFDTGNEYADDRFLDVGFGIHGGFEGFGFAETSIVRNRFIRNTKAGVALGNFNALDIWVWYSLFEDCGVGITNEPGAGNYRVYNSVFRGSRVADLSMQNTGGFTARNNFSIGSKVFWTSGSPINHPATVDIQGNTILDPQSAVVIRMGNQGPGLIIDNRIRSLPKTAGPIVSWSTLFGSDVISVGNVFTVSNAVSANGRLVGLDDRIVTREAIDAAEPVLPGAQPNNRRRVFEVAPGATVEAIQRQIDEAAKAGGERPVVHVPFGSYTLEKTLMMPASDVQLVGDGTRTRLRWAGSGRGPVVSLASPSRATIRELQIEGSESADGVLAAGVDQPNARAYFEGIQLRSGKESNLLIDRAGRARLQFVDVGHAYSPTGTSVQVVGGGSTGPDQPPVVIYSGASSGNRLSYDVRRGGNLVARDIWYEGSAEGGFARVREGGAMTLQGARVATPAGQTPAFTVDSDAARLTLLTTLFDDRLVVQGSSGRADVLAMSNVREDSPRAAFTNSDAAPARALVMTARQRSKAGGLIPRGTVPLPDVGRYDADFVRSMLHDTRSIPAPSLDPAPPGATDIRMFRVWITGSANNLVLAGPVIRE